MSKTEEIVEGISQPIIEEHGCELVDVEYKKEGSDWYLRIYIDKECGVTLEDCEQISRAVEELIDKEDPIDRHYILEVSSPGLDRQLKKEKDFIKYMGHKVDIKLYNPIENMNTKEFTAVLKNYQNDTVMVDYNGELLDFDKKRIAVIRLAVEF